MKLQIRVNGVKMTFKKLKSDIRNMLRMRRAIKYIKKHGVELNECDNAYFIIHLYENGKPTSYYSKPINVHVKKPKSIFLEGDVWDEDLYKIKVIGYRE
jgi:hypothetical protein